MFWNWLTLTAWLLAGYVYPRVKLAFLTRKAIHNLLSSHLPQAVARANPWLQTNWVDLGNQVQALASGQIDAVLTLEPIGTIGVEKGVAKHLVKAPVAELIVDPWIGGAGAVRTEFAEKNPGTTEKVIRAFSRAVDDANKNPDENKKYLPKYTPLNEELSNKVPVLYFIDSEDMTEEDMKALQIFFDLFTEYGAIEDKIDVNGLLYTS